MPPPRPSSPFRAHPLVVRAALVVAGFAVALSTAEIALRLLGVEPARVAHLNSIESADKRAAVDAYPSNPRGELDLDLRDPNVRAPLEAARLPGLARIAERTPWAVAFHYNAQLCRNGPVGPRVPGVPRVVVLGDSFTEGQGVRDEDTFSRGIERSLRALDAGGPAVEVINCGRRGHDFPELLDDFNQRLAYAPDVMLYAMVLNDAAQSPAFRARQSFLDDWILDRRRMLTDEDPIALSAAQSRLRLFVADRIEAYRVGRATTRWYLDMYGPPNREGWAATVMALRAMSMTMSARGGRLVVALLPLLVGLPGHYPFDGPAAEIRRACTGSGITFHDVLPAVRDRESASLWVHPVDRHPNATAHALFARDLAPVVAEALASLPPAAPAGDLVEAPPRAPGP